MTAYTSVGAFTTSFTVWMLPGILGALVTMAFMGRRKAPVSFLGLIAPVIGAQIVFSYYEEPWIRALAVLAALAAYLLLAKAARTKGAPSS